MDAIVNTATILVTKMVTKIQCSHFQKQTASWEGENAIWVETPLIFLKNCYLGTTRSHILQCMKYTELVEQLNMVPSMQPLINVG